MSDSEFTGEWDEQVAQDVLEKLNIRFRVKGSELELFCPLEKRTTPEGDTVRVYQKSGRGHDHRTPSLQIHLGGENSTVPPGTMHCWSCGVKGNFNTLMKLAREAGVSIADTPLFEPPSGAALLGSVLSRKANSEIGLLPSNCTPWEGDYDRGNGIVLTSDFLRWIGAVRWLDTSFLAYRLVIPIQNQGLPVGYVGRALDHDVTLRYRTSPGLPTHLLLFGSQFLPRGAEKVILVEGIVDALWLLQNNIPAVALMGTGWTAAKRGQLLGLCDEAYLMFDGDEAGRNCTMEVYKDLQENAPSLSVYNLPLPDGTDPGEMQADWLSQLRDNLGITDVIWE